MFLYLHILRLVVKQLEQRVALGGFLVILSGLTAPLKPFINSLSSFGIGRIAIIMPSSTTWPLPSWNPCSSGKLLAGYRVRGTGTVEGHIWHLIGNMLLLRSECQYASIDPPSPLPIRSSFGPLYIGNGQWGKSGVFHWHPACLRMCVCVWSECPIAEGKYAPIDPSPLLRQCSPSSLLPVTGHSCLGSKFCVILHFYIAYCCNADTGSDLITLDWMSQVSLISRAFKQLNYIWKPTERRKVK